MKKKAKKKVNRTISLTPEQDQFLRDHKDEINFSDNCQELAKDIMKEWKETHDEVK